MLGSMEWILPVCKYLKKQDTAVNIVFLILRYQKDDIFKNNQFIRDLTNDISSNQCYDFYDLLPKWVKFGSVVFNYLGGKKPVIPLYKIYNLWLRMNWKIFRKKIAQEFIDMIKPDIGLMDTPHNDFFMECKKRGINTGFFLTSPSFAFSSEVWVDEHKRNLYSSNLDYDFFLVDTDWTFNFFKSLYNDNPVFNIGTPKFDTEWINYLIEKSDSLEGALNSDYKCMVLVLLKNESSCIFEEISFEDLLNEILYVCSNIKNAHVILKPHARQNIELLNRIINRYPDMKITVSNLPSFYLMSKARHIVSMPSGVILDALVMGRAVIEYFTYGKLNDVLMHKYGQIPKNSLGGMSYLDRDGRLTSVFRGKGLVLSADTPQELESLLSKLSSGTCMSNGNNVRSMFPDNSSQRAASVIMSMAQNKAPL